MTKSMRDQKKKMLIFHPALAPYRIDQFNLLNELYDLEVVFLFDNIWNFNIDHRNLKDDCHFKISYLLKGPRYKGRVFRFGMYRKIKETCPDIIMGYEFSFSTQYLLLLKSLGLLHQKIGSFIDDSPEICLRVQSKTRRLARNKTVKQLDFWVVMSQEVANFYSNEFKLEKNQVIISPILQLSERLRKNQDVIESFAQQYIDMYQLRGKKVILFVGRFIQEKALPLFINNVYPILKEDDNLVLLLVGDGEQKELLLDLIKEKKLENKIIVPGKYQTDALYGWYTAASGFVLPSLSETFGAVVNEALIFGLTVFCSQYAGAYTLIHPENGRVFNPSDGTETVDKFKQYVDSVKPVGNVRLEEKPPLIEDQRVVFFKEWGKLNNE